MRRKCNHYGCRHTEGDSCNCSCGGKYHGKANEIIVTIGREPEYRARSSKRKVNNNLASIVRDSFMKGLA